ncbi:hypothetical protein [Micromonospora sp. NPDC049274]|uniref:hypothetical protein n=1 Tax=Micromonospora sp. NPDC049274 TaxID=3154829 RepID=UPI003437DC88
MAIRHLAMWARRDGQTTAPASGDGRCERDGLLRYAATPAYGLAAIDRQLEAVRHFANALLGQDCGLPISPQCTLVEVASSDPPTSGNAH